MVSAVGTGCALNDMPILIDGYNLLFAANIVAAAPGPYEFAASRRALLRFLVAVLTEEERRQTTVVFDGRGAPPGLPPQDVFAEISVLFSAPGREADDLIEEILPRYSAPKTLTVVSSDHRVQRAARRRKAITIDSDVWCRQCWQRRQRQRRRQGQPQGPAWRSAADDEGLSAPQVAEWLDEFGEIDVEQLRNEIEPPPTRNTPPTSPQSVDGSATPESRSANDKSTEDTTRSDDRRVVDDAGLNPFPEGYGEDLLDEDGL